MRNDCRRWHVERDGPGVDCATRAGQDSLPPGTIMSRRVDPRSVSNPCGDHDESRCPVARRPIQSILATRVRATCCMTSVVFSCPPLYSVNTFTPTSKWNRPWRQTRLSSAVVCAGMRHV